MSLDLPPDARRRRLQLIERNHEAAQRALPPLSAPPWWRAARPGQHPLWLRALRVAGLIAVGAFLLVSVLVLVGALIFGGPVVQ